jgi:hypothetical protein
MTQIEEEFQGNYRLMESLLDPFIFGNLKNQTDTTISPHILTCFEFHSYSIDF